jgi:cytochrome c
MGPKAKKEGNPDKGKDIFMAQCASCHSMSAMGTGPPLAGVYNAGIAANGGFSYSSALAGKAKLKWNDANLDKWLAKPSGFAPGNKMGFGGIDSKQDRLDLIAYLKANS